MLIPSVNISLYIDFMYAVPDTYIFPCPLLLLLSLWSYKISGKVAGREDRLKQFAFLHFTWVLVFKVASYITYKGTKKLESLLNFQLTEFRAFEH